MNAKFVFIVIFNLLLMQIGIFVDFNYNYIKKETFQKILQIYL